MTRSMETEEDKRREKKAATLLNVCSTGLSGCVEYAGGTLKGFSAKMAGADVLVTIRAEFPAGPMIAFVGGETLANCLIKAAREAKGDALRWKVDQWA